jgi:hypothetical protein
MSETSAADRHKGGNGTATPTRRLLRRPSTEETEGIVRACPPETLTVVDAIRRETGCSRATAYRAVDDAFKAGSAVSEPGSGFRYCGQRGRRYAPRGERHRASAQPMMPTRPAARSMIVEGSGTPMTYW